jgi:hypothetical protein
MNDKPAPGPSLAGTGKSAAPSPGERGEGSVRRRAGRFRFFHPRRRPARPQSGMTLHFFAHAA